MHKSRILHAKKTQKKRKMMVQADSHVHWQGSQLDWVSFVLQAPCCADDQLGKCLDVGTLQQAGELRRASDPRACMPTAGIFSMQMQAIILHCSVAATVWC